MSYTKQQISQYCSQLLNDFSKAKGNDRRAAIAKSKIVALFPQVKRWAKNGIARAQYAMSVVTPHDKDSWLKKAAKGGDFDAMYEWAKHQNDLGNTSKACDFFARVQCGGSPFQKSQVDDYLSTHSLPLSMTPSPSQYQSQNRYRLFSYRVSTEGADTELSSCENKHSSPTVEQRIFPS